MRARTECRGTGGTGEQAASAAAALTHMAAAVVVAAALDARILQFKQCRVVGIL